jgi:hypothetical protein
MNKQIQEFAAKAKDLVPAGLPVDQWIETYNELLAQLIVEECAACCGSQADMRNIRKRFGLPVEGNVKYPAVGPRWSVESQYEREYNIPEKSSEKVNSTIAQSD